MRRWLRLMLGKQDRELMVALGREPDDRRLQEQVEQRLARIEEQFAPRPKGAK